MSERQQTESKNPFPAPRGQVEVKHANVDSIPPLIWNALSPRDREDEEAKAERVEPIVFLTDEEPTSG